MAVKENYEASDFARAVEIVSAETVPGRLTGRFGIDWDYLAWLGLGFAEELFPPDSGERIVSNGGEAFAAGFLIGLYLPGLPDAGREPSISLPAAVESVRERGRHAPIADRCDLGAVAELEDVHAESLVESLELTPPERLALRDPLTRLFESGLAVGLVVGTS